MTVHIKSSFSSSDPLFVCFMNVIELETLTAEGLTNSLLKCLADVGFTEYYLRRNWLAFASDGASLMHGG